MITLLASAAILAAALTPTHAADEMRGAWVTAWEPGIFTAQQADATIQAAKDANLNALFVQVRKVGDAYYESTLEPKGKEIASGFDPLAYTIEKAHAEGIQVHAWLVVYRIWKDPKMPTDPNHLVNAHPEWLSKDNEGKPRASEGVYIDPGIPEYREHFANVCAEIAAKYNVDGIHLDYIRYPGKEWGYADAALTRYYADTGASAKPSPGDPKWLQWRREQVTAMVKLVRDKVKAAKPNVQLTAATIPWGDCPGDFCSATPYAKVCQDWQCWMIEGLLDANVPMNYRVEKTNAKQFRDWLDGFKKWSGGKPVYVGIGDYLNTVPHTLQQIEAVRKNGLDGYVLFSFNQTAKRTALVNAMKRASCASAQAM